MKLASWLIGGILSACHLIQLAWAEHLLEATSLVPCSDNGVIGIDYFSVVFTPSTSSVTLSFDGTINYSGYVLFDVEVLVYGYSAVNTTIDLCTITTVSGLCPLSIKNLEIETATFSMSKDLVSNLPNITYTFPDIDALVRVNMVSNGTSEQISCIETRISNGKTVNQGAVAWVLAIITGVCIVTSVFLSISGHSANTTDLNFRTLLFLSFMQSQAILGMAAVEFPPMAQSWTQMFQWTVGIVHAEFLQNICTWFLRATGGTASTLLSESGKESVYLAKRSTEGLHRLLPRITDTTVNGTEKTVRGIERVGYRINIETTNIFMTSYIFFYFAAFCLIVFILLLSLGLPALAKKVNSAKLDRAAGACTERITLMRGIIYRVVSLGYPQMSVLCLWEIVHRDSPAEIVCGISMWLAMTGVLSFAGLKVFQRGKASRFLGGSPDYTLYSDPICMTKWGFLYINYRAQASWFMIPLIAHAAIRGMVVAFSQPNWEAQSIVLVVVEAGMLAVTAVVRPYMNKKANGFAITACALNFLNAIFLLVFSNIFNQSVMVGAIMGVVWFLFGATFTLVLLVWLLIALYRAFAVTESVNYKRLSDNLSTFQQPENRMETELMPLEKFSRGDISPVSSRWRIDESEHARSNEVLGAHWQPSKSQRADEAPPVFNERSPTPRSLDNFMEPTLPLIPGSPDNRGRRSPRPPD
ncbi:hypothetical protein N7448_007830 [Penicillium atrosanguineum]|uniref:ML-like domain-containing protein n=1 Tax=Penicillium atrosanguineum TaxID=1132637 RepID=A0A9W9KXE3_9EURO|nr:Surfeit locus 4 [Penicillium atrosanguineum]KAJ5127051.1 hypothetical protein N7448_007830 [Penicillium atrosanguineum]KAJ5147257.1 hypothetical protein N7526_000609 [Penicillium atrosanguineum]KAJ5314265.1 Surfeit locus 4 [Penicillium atrosanguineum]KAJ5331432.1 hypothetical protein N7476_001215 [Penicillium atrosanguineum]